MTFTLEVSRGFQAKPGCHRGPAMHRAWWGWFAVGIVTIPWDEFVTKAWDWEEGRGHEQ